MFDRNVKTARLDELAGKAKSLATNRSLSPQEVNAELDRIEAEGESLKAELKNYDRARRFSVGPGETSPASSSIDNGQRLSFKGMGASLAKQILGEDGYGRKALASSGAAVIDQEFRPDPIPLGKVATGLLDVLPVIAHDTANFAYLRQTVRTNNAAVVADGAVKPTSVSTVVRVDSSLVVIAHLSEGVPRYWLLDNAGLQGFVSQELDFGLRLAIEAKIIADINGTSGIQTQAYSTSVIQTLRKSLTALELKGLVAGSIVLHPSDWEGVELALSSTNAIEHMSLPYDPATRRLWGVPIVTTVSQAAGVGFALAQNAVALDTDNQGVGVQWSESSNSDDFSKNLLRARCEGRFATSVYAPFGVVVADLTA